MVGASRTFWRVADGTLQLGLRVVPMRWVPTFWRPMHGRYVADFVRSATNSNDGMRVSRLRRTTQS